LVKLGQGYKVALGQEKVGHVCHIKTVEVIVVLDILPVSLEDLIKEVHKLGLYNERCELMLEHEMQK
jgi:hypothetical protein